MKNLISSLYGYGSSSIVNFYTKFLGSCFFPWSFPGFIHPNILKSGCLVTVFMSPFSYINRLFPVTKGTSFCNTSLPAKLISSISIQSPFFNAFNRLPSTKLKTNWFLIISMFYKNLFTFSCNLSQFCFLVISLAWFWLLSWNSRISSYLFFILLRFFWIKLKTIS